MKKIISILTVTLIAIVIFSFNRKKDTDVINPVIGDISFIKKFGIVPGRNTDEDLRIKTHLEYVEGQLRKKDVSELPSALIEKRNYLLDVLHNYWTAGIFPRNFDHTERKPCFIDKDNRICAVGYLIEKTAGRATAEKINKDHKYDELLAMNDKNVDAWIAASGLTKEECAMIQPSYGFNPQPNYNHIPKAYGISSSALGGINLSMNAIQLLKGNKGKTIPVIGLVTGAGQLVLGIAAFPKSSNSFVNGNTTNESKKTLSMINVGLGTTTMIVSAWNLISNKKIKQRPTTVNLYTVPGEQSKMNVGLSLTRRI